MNKTIFFLLFIPLLMNGAASQHSQYCESTSISNLIDSLEKTPITEADFGGYNGNNPVFSEKGEIYHIIKSIQVQIFMLKKHRTQLTYDLCVAVSAKQQEYRIKFPRKQLAPSATS